MTDQQLRQLAQAYRVAVTYVDWQGNEVTVSPETLRTVLAALGVDVATPAAVRESLRQATRRTDESPLPAVTVVRHGAAFPYRSGVRFTIDGVGPIGDDGALLRDLPLGWYTVRASNGQTGRLAYVPDRLRPPAALTRRAAGLMVQLYSVRSAGSWGMGDLADLAELVRFAGSLGTGFTLVNPLHATPPTPPVPASPYLPASRRFASPLYLRIEQIPEYAALPAAERPVAPHISSDLIDRDAVWRAKDQALRRLYQVPLSDARRQAYHRFVAEQGRALTDFAVWCVLTEEYGGSWRDWPEPLRDPRSPRVAAEAARLADRVEYHMWLQWLVDEQLAAAQRAAVEAGMPLGIMHDLAVGADPDGADAWMHREMYADGVTVGVPPDYFNRLGQDWRQPPWHPVRLAEAGYGPYRDLVRFWLRHGGGLRVDHVMGLFRLWWVPEGGSPTDGTYVHYDHEAMVGILALEAYLAGAVVVGEDLGTVEPWVRDYLADRGVFGTSLLWFESLPDGSPRPPQQWRRECLATVDSHDMPPVAGYASGEFVAEKDRLGLLGGQSAEQARTDLDADVTAWRRMLVSLGLLSDESASLPELTRALHRFLTRTPARLVGLSLTDLVGERRSMNLPGTDREYPNWRVPLGDASGRPVSLEAVTSDPDVAAAITEVVRELNQPAVPSPGSRSAQRPAGSGT